MAQKRRQAKNNRKPLGKRIARKEEGGPGNEKLRRARKRRVK